MDDGLEEFDSPEVRAAVAALTEDEREWLAQEFESITTELEVLTPSQWAEAKRYLPASVTVLPGPYRFDVVPYMREIVDCFSVDSPIREVALMKGVQITATTSVLENVIGYNIDHVRTSPVMMVTADADLAKVRLEQYVIPMIQASNLDHLIKSADEKNPRKTGSTSKKLEWIGGGFLVPFGAVNANKLRSTSIEVMLRDEIDAWPTVVGKDGDPIQLTAGRTKAYEASRKILDLSTPTVKGVSKIAERFARGDQRYYYVCCLECGEPQTLRWSRTDPDTGEVSGILWETERGQLVAESVRYRCYRCGHDHVNDDKHKLLKPENGAEWRPTAQPASPQIRSYHLSALYSPVGMQTWAACVQDWLDAWDERAGRPKSIGKLQVFYNNILGETFEVRGDKIRFETVSAHRRQAYAYGQLPNAFAVEHCGSPVLLVTCSVDVHKNEMPVSVFGWCRDGRSILLDYWRFEGDTEQLEDPGTWGRLRKLIDADVHYVADDGKRYRIQLTLIDSGYRSEQVYSFCAEYASGVAPVKGRELAPKAASQKEFSSFTTPMGTTAYNVTVDIYKERWSAALKRRWDGEGLQPGPFFNAPIDATDTQLKELTAETKREKRVRGSNEQVGWEWHRSGPNELWDLLVYSNAALDLKAWDVCRRMLGLEKVSMSDFYDFIEREALYFEAS